MSTAMPATFFSYSREDSEFALRLAQDLKLAGASVWLDQRDIEAGQEWDNAVEDALTRAPQMLLILSPSSVKSRNVRDEISFALDRHKTIVPVLYRDCKVPLQLHRVQYIDFRTDYAHGLKALLRALGAECPPGQSVSASSEAPKDRKTGNSDAERRKHAAEQTRREREATPGPWRAAGSGFGPALPAWARAVFAVCAIMIVTLVLYWMSKPASSEQTAGVRKPEIPAKKEVKSGSADHSSNIALDLRALLGKSKQEVLRRLGEPDRIDGNYMKYLNPSVWILMSDDTVRSIEFNRPNTVAEGFATGMTRGEIEAKFGAGSILQNGTSDSNRRSRLYRDIVPGCSLTVLYDNDDPGAIATMIRLEDIVGAH